MLDGILHQFSAGLDAEVFHDGVFVEGNGARSEIQNISRLLHQLSLGEQLEDFALAEGQFFGARSRRFVEEHAEGGASGNQRSDIGPAR